MYVCKSASLLMKQINDKQGPLDTFVICFGHHSGIGLTGDSFAWPIKKTSLLVAWWLCIVANKIKIMTGLAIQQTNIPLNSNHD